MEIILFSFTCTFLCLFFLLWHWIQYLLLLLLSPFLSLSVLVQSQSIGHNLLLLLSGCFFSMSNKALAYGILPPGMSSECTSHDFHIAGTPRMLFNVWVLIPMLQVSEIVVWCTDRDFSVVGPRRMSSVYESWFPYCRSSENAVWCTVMIPMLQVLWECHLIYKSWFCFAGLRYFGLVSQRIIFLSLITTIIVLVIGFETRTPYTLAVAFLVLPVEAALVSLFWELGDNLGGTCTGYAIVAPVTALKWVIVS